MRKQRKATGNSIERRNKFIEDLKRLRQEALAALEREGYDVEGKTPSEIREAIRKVPRKRFRKMET